MNIVIIVHFEMFQRRCIIAMETQKYVLVEVVHGVGVVS